jgi:trehalose/maltose hydrolase-like predicted phosphorylase
LKEKGLAVLKATADFWVSRVERNGPGQYDIKKCKWLPDEWAENVDNNAFYKCGCERSNLKYATEAANCWALPPMLDWMNVANNTTPF